MTIKLIALCLAWFVLGMSAGINLERMNNDR